MIVTYLANGSSSGEEYAKCILETPLPQSIDESTFEVIRQIKGRLDRMRLDIPMVMRNYTMSVQYCLELLAFYPESALRHFRIQTANAIVNGDKAIKEGASVIGVGGHVGAKNTSMTSPTQYRGFILPGIKEQIDAFHQIGAKCYIASGGCVWPFIDAFLIESGADGYGGIDVDAGMDISKLKDMYGKRICFIGAIDSVHTLTNGTASQIREEVFRMLDLFDGSSGFILASSNSIHNGIPPRNFIRMIESYKDYYKL